MASLLERAYLPTGGVGLTAGVNYFGDVGQRQAVSFLRPPNNVSPAAPTLPAAEVATADAGWRVNPPEPGFGGGYDGSMGGSGVTGTPQGAIDAFGLTGQAATALGLLSQDPGLVSFGSTLGQGASIANAAMNPSVSTIGPIAMSQMGVPAPAAGAVMGAVNNGVPGAVSGLAQGLAFTNPMTAAYSLMAPVVGLPTIGQMANNAMTAINYGTNFGSQQTGMIGAQNAGMFGIGAQSTNVGSTPADATAVGYGTNFGSEQTGMLAAQDAGFVDGPNAVGPFGGISEGFDGSPSAPSANVGISEGFDGSPGAASGANSGAAEGFDGSPASDGGGGGGGGGKIICTAMNHAYGFGSFRNAIWIAYADKHLTKAHEVGYHTLFLPLVDYGFKRGDGKLNLLVRRVLEWGTRHRSTDLRAEMRGTKRDTTGRIIRFIFEPLCYVVGRIKGAR